MVRRSLAVFVFSFVLPLTSGCKGPAGDAAQVDPEDESGPVLAAEREGDAAVDSSGDGSSGSAGDSESGADEAVLQTPDLLIGDWTVIGHSVQGRPIRKQIIGVGPRRVLWVGGIHGNEREGLVATTNLLSALRRVGDLEQRVSLTIVEDINPDGSARNKRGNARGKDLNRNFPAKNALPGSKPLSEPESQVLHDLIQEFRPDTVMVAHSWGAKPDGVVRFVNYDGPGERLAQIFSQISGFPVRTSKHLPATPGSLGSWVGVDQQIPILTIEFERGSDPRQNWIDTREAILAVIRG